MIKLHQLTAQDAIKAMTEASCSSEELVSDCLKHIDARENLVGAWSHLDPDNALSQARAADKRNGSNEASACFLNGVPVGIKDILDTKDMPTENGTPIHKGRYPDRDAAIVDQLRKAGAVVMGKTVTAELAVYSPGKTTNPHDPNRTPGGSSSGSAAAVAAGMVPLAIGTQTNGSVIRPASYCGVVGYKPTFGTLPRAGILRQAPSLDQVGVFSRTVSDSALLVSALADSKKKYGDTLSWPKLDLTKIRQGFQPSPRLAYVKTPVWDEATSSTKIEFTDYVHNLGAGVVSIELPEVCSSAVACMRTIMLSEMAHNYTEFYDHHKSLISPMLLSMIEEGMRVTLTEYFEAKNISLEIIEAVENALINFDAVLTPATQAEAPEGLESTGSPIFCTIWSLCGTPAVSLPLLRGASGMPMGLQLVSARGADSSLLRAACWLENKSVKYMGKQ